MKKALSEFSIAQEICKSSFDSSVSSELYMEIIFLLKLGFSQYEVEDSGFVDYREIVNSILFGGMRFHNNEVFSLLQSYATRSEGRIDFKEYLKLLNHTDVTYNKLRQLSMNKVRRDTSLLNDTANYGSIISDTTLKNIGFPAAKITKIREAFELIDADKDGKVSVDDLRGIMRLSSDTDSLFLENQIYKCLNYKDREHITMDDILASAITKEGVIGIYNLLVVARRSPLFMQQEPMKQTSKISTIHRDDNGKGRSDSRATLDLLEAFEYLDVDGSLVIKKSFLHENSDQLQSKLDPHMLKAAKSLLELDISDISFFEFLTWVHQKGISSQTVLDLAKEYYDLWLLNQEDDHAKQLNELLNVQRLSEEDHKHECIDLSFNIKEEALKQSITSNNWLGARINNLNSTDKTPTKTSVITNQSSRGLINLQNGHVDDSVTSKLSASKGDSNDQSRLNFLFMKIVQDKITEDEMLDIKGFIDCKREELNLGEPLKNKEISQLEAEIENLRRENKHLKESSASKDQENIASKEKACEVQNRLKKDLVSKQDLISQLKKQFELENHRSKIEKEDTFQSNFVLKGLKEQVNQNERELDRLKQKVREQDEREAKYKQENEVLSKKVEEKTKEVNALNKSKQEAEQTFKATETKTKNRLDYVLQLFSEYLKQNTALQSQVHDKENKMKALEKLYQQEKEDHENLRLKHKLKLDKIKEVSSEKSSEESNSNLEAQNEIENLKKQLQQADLNLQNQRESFEERILLLNQELEEKNRLLDHTPFLKTESTQDTRDDYLSSTEKTTPVNLFKFPSAIMHNNVKHNLTDDAGADVNNENTENMTPELDKMMDTQSSQEIQPRQRRRSAFKLLFDQQFDSISKLSSLGIKTNYNDFVNKENFNEERVLFSPKKLQIKPKSLQIAKIHLKSKDFEACNLLTTADKSNCSSQQSEAVDDSRDGIDSHSTHRVEYFKVEFSDLIQKISIHFNNIMDFVINKLSEMDSKITYLTEECSQYKKAKEDASKFYEEDSENLKAQLKSLHIKYEDQKDILLSQKTIMESLARKQEHQFFDKEEHYKRLLTTLTDEIRILKSGGISDL